MTHRIISKDEITKSKILTVAARVALHAEQEKGSYDFKMDEVDDLISDLYKGDLTFENKRHVDLMKNVVMGALHALSVAPDGFSGTAAMGGKTGIIARMASGHRPSAENPNEPIYMIEAVTDSVIVEVARSGGAVEPVLRHQLKSDLSNALVDFRLLRKEGAEKEAVYNLFSAVTDE